MVITANNGVFEQYDKAMPKSHWMRNKKQTVNLLYDQPFALERQLEDQRLSSERNRNPQFYNPTKVDRVRSEKIIAKTGASRAVAVKANVLNKIVREASGVHNYTIVAPPRELAPLTKMDLENKDPETNPRMKAYAAESKSKPTLCSFGHRPSSASRTFHPATMKFRLKHGEIAGDVKKTGFGLPVAVLKQVIKAPKIYLPGSSELMDERTQTPNRVGSPKLGSPKQPSMTQNDLHGMFFTPEEQSDLLYNNNNATGGGGGGKVRRSVRLVEEEGSTSQATWISTQERKAAAAAASGGQKKKSGQQQVKQMEPSQLTANSTLSSGVDPIDRPEWDAAHHRIKVAPNEVFKLRVSGLNDLAQVPLSEKLTRFAKLAVAESQFVPFCTEKQKTDKIIQSGAAYSVPASVPLEGHPLYFDPWDVELNEVKRYRRETEKRQREQREAQRYQDHLALVPAVEYYPTTKLHRLKAKQQQSSSSSAGGARDSPGSPPSQQQQYEPSSSSLNTQKSKQTLLSFNYPMTLNKLATDSLELMHEPSTTSLVGSGGPAAPPAAASLSVTDYATLNRQYHMSRSLPALEKSVTLENDFKKAMKAAKKGDRLALFEHNMKEDGKRVGRRNKRGGARKTDSRGGGSGSNPGSPYQQQSPQQQLRLTESEDEHGGGGNVSGNEEDKKYLAMLEAEESFALENSESLAEDEE